MLTILKNIVLSAFALSNQEFIQKHNSENHSYLVEENQFINATYNDEFNQIDHNIFVSNDNPIVINFTDLYQGSVDWRKKK